jgi:hypothetical protein
MTPHFEIVEAKVQHCGQMTRLLRGAHREAVATTGVNMHRELRDRFEESTFRRAWLANGVLIGLGGVTGPVIAQDGIVWLALTEQAVRYPVAMLREARRQIEEIMALKWSLMAVILPDDAASFRFARRLGFAVRPDVPTIFEAVAMEYRSRLREAA